MLEVKSPFTKSSVSILEIGISWSKLLGNTDTIASSVWSCDSPDITFSRQQISGALASCLISGGTDGSRYEVFNTVTTATGLVDRRYIVVEIEETQLSS